MIRQLVQDSSSKYLHGFNDFRYGERLLIETVIPGYKGLFLCCFPPTQHTSGAKLNGKKDNCGADTIRDSIPGNRSKLTVW